MRKFWQRITGKRRQLYRAAVYRMRMRHADAWESTLMDIMSKTDSPSTKVNSAMLLARIRLGRAVMMREFAKAGNGGWA